jgi:hypothetical protein
MALSGEVLVGLFEGTAGQSAGLRLCPGCDMISTNAKFCMSN